MNRYSITLYSLICVVLLIACSSESSTKKIPSLAIEKNEPPTEQATKLLQQSQVTVTNIIRGDVISSTVYQTKILSQTNATIIQADAESPEQATISIAGDELIQAIKSENNILQKVDTFKEKASAAISANTPDRKNLVEQISQITKVAATLLTIQGETAASQGNYENSDQKFELAQKLNPPMNIPIYVKIPAGESLIGNADYDSDLDSPPDIDDMKNQELIYLRSYWILRTEVTNAQYQRCVEAKACEPLLGYQQTGGEFQNHPVILLWDDAKTYAKWVGGRLPTNAEWEKACRGTDGRLYPWGNDKAEPMLANYNTGVSTEVGKFLKGASPYGILDMAGNVFEYTSEYYGNSIFETVRGGSFWTPQEYLRCTMKIGPAFSKSIYGFRNVIPTHD